MIKKLKMYMGYSHVAGSSEGAVLVFAYSVREAKKLAFNTYLNDYCDNEWTDIRANLIKGCEWLWKCKRKDIPHVVDNPTSCSHCLSWGGSPIDDEGICEDCKEDLKDSL